MTDSNPPNDTDQSAYSRREVSNLFQSLKRPERRNVLLYLHDSDAENVSVNELSEYVSRRLVEEDEALVRSSLQHWHLPKLADLECIHYEPEQGVVRTRRRADELLNRFVR